MHSCIMYNVFDIMFFSFLGLALARRLRSMRQNVERRSACNVAQKARTGFGARPLILSIDHAVS
jgi:hypothetical protein